MRILADRTRAVSYVTMLIIGAALFSTFYFISLFVQQVLGYGPLQAGFAFLPFSAGIVIAAQVASASPRGSTRAGSPAPVLLSRPSGCGAMLSSP